MWPIAIIRPRYLHDSIASENQPVTSGRFGAPVPQESGAGQRSFVWAGNRPKPARRSSPNLPDAQPRLYAFRIYEAAVRDLQ